MPVTENITGKLKQVVRILDKLPEIAGQEATNFFKERFEEQGWRDSSFDPWQRKKTDNSYPTLRSRNTSGLVDTIHYERQGKRSVVIKAGGPGKPYARIHNEGGTINVPVTSRMRAFMWARYYKTKDPRYKAIALQKKTTMQIRMPKRQYLGSSKVLYRNIETVVYNNLKRILS